MELKQSITLKKFRIEDLEGNELTGQETSDLFKEMFEDAYIAQNYILKKFLEANDFSLFEKDVSHTAKRARALPAWEVPSKYNQTYTTNELAQREVNRILKTYIERLKIAKILESNNWNITFDKFLKIYKPKKFINIELFKNLLKAKELPVLQEIPNPVIPLSYTNPKFGNTAKLIGNIIFLENLALIDKRYNLFFEIPKKYFSRLKNIQKVSKPNLRIEKDTADLCFDFTFTSEVDDYEDQTKTLGGDLGMVRPMTATVVEEDGYIYEEFDISLYSERDNKKLNNLRKEYNNILKKKERKSALNLDTEYLNKELYYISNKISGVKKSLAWNVATDLATSIDRKTTIVLEDLRWVEGGSKWNTGEFRTAILHQGKKNSKKVKFKNPNRTSQRCCNCGKQVTHDTKNRTVHCKNCELKLDRDSNSSRNLILKEQNIKNCKDILESKQFSRIYNLNSLSLRYTGLQATICSKKLNLLTSYRIGEKFDYNKDYKPLL